MKKIILRLRDNPPEGMIKHATDSAMQILDCPGDWSDDAAFGMMHVDTGDYVWVLHAKKNKNGSVTVTDSGIYK